MNAPRTPPLSPSDLLACQRLVGADAAWLATTNGAEKPRVRLSTVPSLIGMPLPIAKWSPMAGPQSFGHAPDTQAGQPGEARLSWAMSVTPEWVLGVSRAGQPFVADAAERLADCVRLFRARVSNTDVSSAAQAAVFQGLPAFNLGYARRRPGGEFADVSGHMRTMVAPWGGMADFWRAVATKAPHLDMAADSTQAVVTLRTAHGKSRFRVLRTGGPTEVANVWVQALGLMPRTGEHARVNDAEQLRAAFSLFLEQSEATVFALTAGGRLLFESRQFRETLREVTGHDIDWFKRAVLDQTDWPPGTSESLQRQAVRWQGALGSAWAGISSRVDGVITAPSGDQVPYTANLYPLPGSAEPTALVFGRKQVDAHAGALSTATVALGMDGRIIAADTAFLQWVTSGDTVVGLSFVEHFIEPDEHGEWFARAAQERAPEPGSPLTLRRFGQPAMKVYVTATQGTAGGQSVTLLTLTAADGAPHTPATQDGAISRFLAVVSHELRTPLNAVAGLSELLADERLEPEHRDMVSAIRANAGVLRHLVDDILDYTSLGQEELQIAPHDVRLSEVLLEAAETVSLDAALKRLDLVCELSPALPERVFADGRRLRQVVVNLLNNAVKYTDEGEISLRASTERTPAGGVHLRLEVCDTGPGIPAHERASIFQRFSRGATAHVAKGVGLGLAVSHALVTRMGGDIRVGDAPSGGAAFSVQLPLVVREGPKVGEGLAGRFVYLDVANQTRHAALTSLLTARGARVLPAPPTPTQNAIVLSDLGLDQRLARRDMHADARVVWLVDRTRRLADAPSGHVAIYKPVRPDRLIDTMLGRSQPGEVAVLSGRRGRRRPSRVLVVDDSPDNRLLYQRALGAVGYKVDVAENGQVAVDRVKAERFDVILMDIHMPVLGGIDATAQIRAHERRLGRGRTPILAVTAHAVEAIAEQALRAGCDVFLTKPISSSQLRAVIARQLDDRVGVLIVDDFGPNRALMARQLERVSGLRRYTGADGHAAQELVRSHRVDVALIDLELPDMNGIELAHALIQEHGDAAPVMIAVTGHADRATHDAALAAGMAGVMIKPVPGQMLRQAVRDAMQTEAAPPDLDDDEERDTAITRRKDLMPMSDTQEAALHSRESAVQSVEVRRDVWSQIDEEVWDLVPVFLAHQKKALDRVDHLLSTGDLISVARIGHNLKGSARNYGLIDLGTVGAALERAAREGFQDGVKAHATLAKDLLGALESAMPPNLSAPSRSS